MRLTKLSYDITLSPITHATIAVQGGQHALMTEVLAPGLKLLRRPAQRFTKRGQGASKAMGG